jgi:NADPH-dependent glutamate synthase beta subunit-like oxidoreductase/NAD(P)H-flavin reductase
MKSCIYQKQSPVDIPQIETRVLTDVLALPWGVEIYDLLTRWNPLRRRQWLPKPYNGNKILIAGQGPAGITLAHYLLMEGCAVVGIEGLKIEPLPQHLLHQPVRDWKELEEPLDRRVMTGFGGVAEYGITVRWDKNFLKLVYLSLARRPYFQVYGGVRFGGTLTVEDAWQLGFDHVSIAVGAGLPQALPIPGSLAPGMRQASDFLMALQLTGAAKADSLANLQVRLPAVIIGGGLTGVDTATEVQAYYLIQIEKILCRYETLAQTIGEDQIRAGLDAVSLEILEEFLQHGRELREERKNAERENRPPDTNALLRRWGGVTVAYRRAMQESPAYTRNHEELSKALEEGIYYAEGLEPKAARLDRYGHVVALACQRRVRDGEYGWRLSEEETVLPARSIFVATGAKPNVAYEFEHKGHFQRDGFQYVPHHALGGRLQPLPQAKHCKEPDFGAFTSYMQISPAPPFTKGGEEKSPPFTKGGSENTPPLKKGAGGDFHYVSFIGDTHPVFHGSVVKAIASGMRAYPHILKSLGAERLARRGDAAEYAEFRAQMQDRLNARVVKVQRHTPSVVELTIRAPQAAAKFQPGQFFRLQNFETFSALAGETRLQTEAIAVLGAGADAETGEISVMLLEQGASTKLAARLQPGDAVALMGPTGVKARMYDGGETVLLIGGRLGAAVARTLGKKLRQAGNRVLYIAGFREAAEVYCQDELEDAADAILWITEQAPAVTPRRPQDRAVAGDFLDILTRYAGGEWGEPAIPLQQVTKVQIVGSPRLARLIQQARHGALQSYFQHSPAFTASVHGPMQCMLKGVCAQCLQWQIDPASGQRTKAVFACSWQDQPLDIVDLDNLDERLSQNRLQEHLSDLWLEHVTAG